MSAKVAIVCSVSVFSLLGIPVLGQDLFLANELSSVEQVRLRNGVMMPIVAVSTGSANATVDAIALAWKAGVTHFLTASNYNTQKEVGVGVRKLHVPRNSYFITTMTSPCICNQPTPHCKRNITDVATCYAVTREELELDLKELGVDYVDLLLLHGPSTFYGNAGGCDALACAANRAQWRAYSEFHAAGKARAVGVSNFCPSCLDCILSMDGTEAPAVNQVQYHLAMGPDPIGLISYCASHEIVLQAYFPLAHGGLIADTNLVKIGAAHNKTGAQVAMKWILQNSKARPGTAIVTSSTSAAHLREDLDIFSWQLTLAEMDLLNAMTCHEHPEYCSYMDGRPSWGCGQ